MNKIMEQMLREVAVKIRESVEAKGDSVAQDVYIFERPRDAYDCGHSQGMKEGLQDGATEQYWQDKALQEGVIL